MFNLTWTKRNMNRQIEAMMIEMVKALAFVEPLPVMNSAKLNDPSLIVLSAKERLRPSKKLNIAPAITPVIDIMT